MEASTSGSEINKNKKSKNQNEKNEKNVRKITFILCMFFNINNT